MFFPQQLFHFKLVQLFFVCKPYKKYGTILIMEFILEVNIFTYCQFVASIFSVFLSESTVDQIKRKKKKQINLVKSV